VPALRGIEKLKPTVRVEENAIGHRLLSDARTGSDQC
jgi:hypothetical protein